MNTVALGTRIDSTSYQEVTERVLAWSRAAESRYICVANVHMVMEAYDSPGFRNIVNNADLVTPDGMPLVWLLRIKGVRRQNRVYGPTLMIWVVKMAAREKLPVGLLGATPHVLEKLAFNLRARFPGLEVAYTHSPPFRPLLPHENNEIISNIRSSGARIIFVGLGCPKQERWMAEHHSKTQTVMLGVGAAFDIHAGQIMQAPPWMQKASLEWLFRLSTEPGRLWRRYFFHNPRFIVLAAAEMIGLKRAD